MENEKRKSNSRNSSIPEEIICDIFSRLPVDSLMRFKCLSKSYNALISNPYFVDTHHSHSISHPGRIKFLTRSRDGNFSYTIDQKVEQKRSSVVRIEH